MGNLEANSSKLKPTIKYTEEKAIPYNILASEDKLDKLISLNNETNDNFVILLEYSSNHRIYFSYSTLLFFPFPLILKDLVNEFKEENKNNSKKKVLKYKDFLITQSNKSQNYRFKIIVINHSIRIDELFLMIKLIKLISQAFEIFLIENNLITTTLLSKKELDRMRTNDILRPFLKRFLCPRNKLRNNFTSSYDFTNAFNLKVLFPDNWEGILDILNGYNTKILNHDHLNNSFDQKTWNRSEKIFRLKMLSNNQSICSNISNKYAFCIDKKQTEFYENYYLRFSGYYTENINLLSSLDITTKGVFIKSNKSLVINIKDIIEEENKGIMSKKFVSNINNSRFMSISNSDLKIYESKNVILERVSFMPFILDKKLYQCNSNRHLSFYYKTSISDWIYFGKIYYFQMEDIDSIKYLFLNSPEKIRKIRITNYGNFHQTESFSLGYINFYYNNSKFS